MLCQFDFQSLRSTSPLFPLESLSAGLRPLSPSRNILGVRTKFAPVRIFSQFRALAPNSPTPPLFFFTPPSWLRSRGKTGPPILFFSESPSYKQVSARSIVFTQPSLRFLLCQPHNGRLLLSPPPKFFDTLALLDFFSDECTHPRAHLKFLYLPVSNALPLPCF